MLTYLNIKNFAIIDQLALSFQSGMIVLTGETGAGKSIIIDTLDLVLGARADNSMIRSGEERCEITAIFAIKNLYEAKLWLKERDLLASDDECIVRRVFSRDGRGRSTINDCPCTQQSVRELGGFLLSIYGQHEHQALLKRDKQRNLLDAFANNKDLCDAVGEAYRALALAKNECASLRSQSLESDVRVDILRYQINELLQVCDAQKLVDDLEKLEQELHQLSNAESIMADCQEALLLIENEEDSRLAISESLYVAKNALEKNCAIDPRLKNATELLTNAIIQVATARDEVRHYLAAFDLDPNRLRYLETRLDAIYKLSDKHRVKPSALHTVYTNLSSELEKLENIALHLVQSETKVQELTSSYLIAAQKLSLTRYEAAKQFSFLITEKMQDLSLAGGVFSDNLDKKDPIRFNEYGLEDIEFLVSTNPGSSLMPLNKIASGGELSRIGLAIQVVTASIMTMPTLIFDEVDVGIGGKTAEIVGRLLSLLSRSVQIICITHLPQVAVYGAQHLKIAKQTSQDAKIIIEQIEGDARVVEIARMLGGIDITAKTLEHAREMVYDSSRTQLFGSKK